MKTWLLFVFVCSAAFTALGVEPQPRVKGDAIYLYCSASTQNTQEGIERYEDPKDDNDPLFAHRPITFEMRSKQKNIYILFIHCSFNPAELSKTRPVDPAKDQMEIMITSRGMLKFIYELKPITLEDKLASFRTKEEVWTWMDSLKTTGKRIYILDWNDSFNQNGNGQIKLTQVMPGATNRPLY